MSTRTAALPLHRERPQLLGAVLCVASAAGFGAMGIFGKLAFEAGVGILSLLVVRFILSAAVLAAVAARRQGRARPRGRTLLAGLALGGIGYAAQSGLFFGALERLDASLVALLLYTFPAYVTLGAVALGRDRLDAVRVGSIALAFTGLALVLLSGAPGELDPLGLAFAFGAPLVYTAYILTSDAVLADTEPLTMSALVCVGGAITFTLAGAVSGGVDLSFEPVGWLWLGCIVVVSTVLAIVCFFAGLGLVGPSRASIISTVEPLITVVLAMIVFGEALSAVQVLGGALVLGSVVLLQTVGRPSAASPPV